MSFLETTKGQLTAAAIALAFVFVVASAGIAHNGG